MTEIDLTKIVPRCGGQRESFEELVCQLARRVAPDSHTFERLRGDGGDGGVECYSDDMDGGRTGWQAKYVYEIGPLLKQAGESLGTAKTIHPSLKKYVVAFPFDLTGKTGRPGKSDLEKWNEWKDKQETKAHKDGLDLTIEHWSLSEIRSNLLEHDPSGGIRAYFFDTTVLTDEWFESHLENASKAAGPRYTKNLNVETLLWNQFEAFGRSPVWREKLETLVDSCFKTIRPLQSIFAKLQTAAGSPDDSTSLFEEIQSYCNGMETLLADAGQLSSHVQLDNYEQTCDSIQREHELLRRIGNKLSHNDGESAIPDFRDCLSIVRAHANSISDLIVWLYSSECSLAFSKCLLLTGNAGSGKTHGVCDLAHRRLEQGLFTCVVFGTQFRGEPDPFTRFMESIQLAGTKDPGVVLDALNAAAEAQGAYLIVVIDAINETRPLSYWKNQLGRFVHEISRREHLRLCITCRSSFIQSCVPEHIEYSVVEHHGFLENAREACKAFFEYYGIEPPITPILQPELSNPLYLKLICEALQSQGESKLPAGWYGLAPAISAFLGEHEKQFAVESELSPGLGSVSGSLRVLAREVIEKGDDSVRMSRASELIFNAYPNAANRDILEWLIRADLLIEDLPYPQDELDTEIMVRISFQRLSDYLIASELLDGLKHEELGTACSKGGGLHGYIGSLESIHQSSNIVSALSVVIPDRWPGTELFSFILEGVSRNAVARISTEALPERSRKSYSDQTIILVEHSLAQDHSLVVTMDAIISVAWQTLPVDGFWLSSFLQRTELANRDAFWCSYLQTAYELYRPPRRLINAVFELSVSGIDQEVAIRWAVLLVWFTAAADRRVKDESTRAVVLLLENNPEIIPALIEHFIDVDDDSVRERLLLAIYAALIHSQNEIVGAVATKLLELYSSSPEKFQNAKIRDHIRCIAELARYLNALPASFDPECSMRRAISAWQPDIPSDKRIEDWKELPKIVHSCLDDDFYFYSMGCLSDWMNACPKQTMAKWIVSHVIETMGYGESLCSEYDRSMGYGGRGKDVWAERIGKKYQWIALYRLASHLHDTVERENSLGPDPIGTPLILLEERKLDPTISIPREQTQYDKSELPWWFGEDADLELQSEASDEEWVQQYDDLPDAISLLKPVTHAGQQWRPLNSYFSRNSHDLPVVHDEEYRNIWMRVHGYLVDQDDLDKAFNSVHRRNYFGNWLSGGGSYLYGFTGEYPWATPFNTLPDEWYGVELQGRNLPVGYTAAWSELVSEWEYDSSGKQSYHIKVPSKRFFDQGDLWWNGVDGYQRNDGVTVFTDPGISTNVPGALLADSSDLQNRLKTMGVGVLWAILGEKRILGGWNRDGPRPFSTFSQAVVLNSDGSLRVGDRVFFDDHAKDASPLVE